MRITHDQIHVPVPVQIPLVDDLYPARLGNIEVRTCVSQSSPAETLEPLMPHRTVPCQSNRS